MFIRRTGSSDVSLAMIAWVLLLVVVSIGQAQDICHLQKTCNACIQEPGCMWCSKPKANVTQSGQNYEVVPNCQPSSDEVSSFCDPENIENPKNDKWVTVKIPLTTVNTEKTDVPRDEKIVQLYPQGVKLKLRKGTSENITVKYRQAQDYPIDLYYLMDLSKTMADDRKNVVALGGKLTATLRSLTSQFAIGFGSYVDKVMMPITDVTPDLPPPDDCVNCTTPFSFRNNLKLSSDGDEFSKMVGEAQISYNLDEPEGGFDALMQAMVCKEEIGWRDQARRIIVFSTDSVFHYAGDGRLVGVVTPNDEKCHLNDVGEYPDYDKYDYPSIAQINKVSKEQGINIIFAVSSHEALYKELSELIETSSHGLMNNDSSNVVELVVKHYEEISSVVRLTDNSTNSPVTIRYSSSCMSNEAPEPTNHCSGLTQGGEVTFNLEVEVIECPKDPKTVIVEVKTMEDILLLEVELDCSCGCAKKGRIDNSSFCHQQGDLVCGVCECFPGFQGANCLCSDLDFTDGKSEGELLCTAPGDSNVCSGQGTCSCGACACQEAVITGKYCECNSRKCRPISGEELKCSGHGNCDCNNCVCDPGYEGTFCECRTEDVCRKDPEAKKCSGHGHCECGKCKCDHGYSGQFCEDCPTCMTGKCAEFRDRVQCLFKTPQCETNLTTTVVDSLKPYIAKGAKECQFQDESNDCLFSFSYLYRDHDMDYGIHVKREEECPESPPIMAIVFGLVSAIVAAGLLTLFIWKVVTIIHDRNEYARFEDEKNKADWNEGNPLYRSPIQTTENPIVTPNVFT